MFRCLILVTALLLATAVAAAAKKPAVSSTPLRTSFLGDDTLNCYGENERCIVPVYVQSDGTATGCVVRFSYGQINVKPSKFSDGRKIKIVWLLQLSDSDEEKNEYQWHVTDGVRPNAGQDPDNEYRDKKRDNDEAAGKKRFRWTSHHPGQKGKDVKYTLVAQRVVGGNTRDCLPVDPTITNQL